MTDPKNFEILDRTIEGSKYAEPATTEQGDSAEFLSAIDKLLAVDGILEVRWSQYTPYFNDGDACIFSVHEAHVKLAPRFNVEEDAGDYENGYIGLYEMFEYIEKAPIRAALSASYEERQRFYDDSNKRFELNGQSTAEIYAALQALNFDRFETVAKLNFGDHAEVTATTEGFTVESYEHD